ncbi:MAG: hypothetical protein KME29_04595 [Calothrix sp. FI2-JRJ7]|nr:hypothetical protein [Calothrix sp. FI2-JRJ7]
MTIYIVSNEFLCKQVGLTSAKLIKLWRQLSSRRSISSLYRLCIEIKTFQSSAPSKPKMEYKIE